MRSLFSSTSHHNIHPYTFHLQTSTSTEAISKPNTLFYNKYCILHAVIHHTKLPSTIRSEYSRVLFTPIHVLTPDQRCSRLASTSTSTISSPRSSSTTPTTTTPLEPALALPPAPRTLGPPPLPPTSPPKTTRSLPPARTSRSLLQPTSPLLPYLSPNLSPTLLSLDMSTLVWDLSLSLSIALPLFLSPGRCFGSLWPLLATILFELLQQRRHFIRYQIKLQLWGIGGWNHEIQ
jgi:hypothetical protein